MSDLLQHALGDRLEDALAHFLIDREVDGLNGHDLLCTLAALRGAEADKARRQVRFHNIFIVFDRVELGSTFFKW